MSVVSQVRVTNQSNFARPTPDFFRCVVPFARGSVPSLDRLRIPNVACRFLPFGAPHLDGSVQYALLEGWVSATPFQEQLLSVELSAGPVARTLAELCPEVPAIPFDLRLGMEQPSRGVGALSSTSAGYGRIGRFWYRLTLDPVPGEPLVYWQLSVGLSNPADPEWEFTQDRPLTLTAPSGALIAVKWTELKGAVCRFQSWGQEWTLSPAGTTWGDGQVQTWRGVVMSGATMNVAAANEAKGPMLACATNWQASGAFGPFRTVPDLPPWMSHPQNGRDWIYRQIRGRAPSSDLWRLGAFGCGLVPGGTGDQNDFGLMQGWPGALLGEPLYLELLLPEVLQESCRPIHHREVDGTQWKSASHPQARFWDCRWHYNTSVSPDQGKLPTPTSNGAAAYCMSPRVAIELLRGDRTLTPDERSHLSEAANYATASFQTHNWWGYDNQHWSHNYLIGAALLSGDPQVMMLCEDLVECFLAQQLTSPPFAPSFPTAGPDAARAIGRTLQSGSQLYMVTGNTAIRDRIRDRVRLTVDGTWAAKGVQPPGARPVMLMPTDSRQGPNIPINSMAMWPWQEAIAVVGLVAVTNVTGDALGLTIAKELARTVAAYGWQERGLLDQIANCVVWNNGADVDRNDPTRFMPADHTDFWMWAAAAMMFAEQWGFPGAADIVTGIRSRRTPPSDLGFDRFGPWTALPTAPVT